MRARLPLFLRRTRPAVRPRQSITPPSESVTEASAGSKFEAPEGCRTLRCCLIGPTNAGKSTLLNALINSTVSIVSDKIHTTRENTLGYLTDEELKAQVEFIDAPGALGPHVPVLRRAIWDAVRRADLALVVVDASDRKHHYQCASFLSQLGAMLRNQESEDGVRTQSVLVLNKVDRVHPKTRLLEISSELHKAHRFDWPCLMVSALHGGGVKQLRDWLLLMSKPGDWAVPAGIAHVQPPVQMATEIIRAEIFNHFRQELPYLISQRTVGWTELRNGHLRIDQQLVVPTRKKSTRRIFESALATVGTRARMKLTEAFGRTVHLTLSISTSSPDEEQGL